MTAIWISVRSYFQQPDLLQCLAECSTQSYRDLVVVTQCNHIFCRECLKPTLEKNQTCPLCRAAVGQLSSEDEAAEKKIESIPFKLFLEKFTHYIQNDFSTLQNKLIAKKILNIKTYGERVQARPNPEDHTCSICLDMPFQMYFVIQDTHRDHVGCHLHGKNPMKKEGEKECLPSIELDPQSSILEITVEDLVKVTKELPEPRKQALWAPFKKIAPILVFVAVIVFPISIWALAMNTRVYQNQSSFLYVLSMPTLALVKMFSFFFKGIKSIFSEKKTSPRY